MAVDRAARQRDLRDYRPEAVVVWGVVLALAALAGYGFALAAGWLQ